MISGEKGYVKDCLTLGFGKSACENIANTVKSQAESYQQNQTSNNTELQGTKSFVDNEAGFSLEYPADWHQMGSSIVKGSREFSPLIISDPKFSLLDTSNFGDIYFDSRTDEKNVKVIDKPGRILIGGEPAVSFSYSEGEKQRWLSLLCITTRVTLSNIQPKRKTLTKIRIPHWTFWLN